MRKILPFILFFLFLGNLFSQDDCSTKTEYYNCKYIQNDTYLTVLLSMNNPSQAEADALLQMYGTKKCQRRTVVLTPNEVEDCKKEIEKERLKEEEEKRQEEKQKEILEKIKKQELALIKKCREEKFSKYLIYLHSSYHEEFREWNMRDKDLYEYDKYDIKKIVYLGSSYEDQRVYPVFPYKIFWENGNIKEEGVFAGSLFEFGGESCTSIEQGMKKIRDRFSYSFFPSDLFRTDIFPNGIAFVRRYDKNGNLTYRSEDSKITKTFKWKYSSELLKATIKEKVIQLDLLIEQNHFLNNKYGRQIFTTNRFGDDIKVIDPAILSNYIITHDGNVKFPPYIEENVLKEFSIKYPLLNN